MIKTLDFSREGEFSGTNPEGDDSAGVPQYRMPNVGLQLMQILMGDREPYPVLTQFREHVRDRKRGEGLEFIDIHEEVSPFLRGHVGPAERRKPDRRDQKPPSRDELSSPMRPLPKLTKSTWPGVHDLADVQVMFRCAHDAIEQGIGEKGADLVLYRRHAVGAVAEREALELLFEKGAHRLILQRPGDTLAIFLVGEHAENVMQRGVRLLQKCQQDVAQNVLHAHAPRIGPHLLEDFHEPGGCQGPEFRAHLPQRIVAIRLRRIGGVEIDDIVTARQRNTGGNPLDQVAVRIDDGESNAALHVLQRHRFQERRLAGPRFSDDIDMGKAVLWQNSKDPSVVSKINSSQMNDLP